jgi:transcription-repair coupling factor (superfamily II helicase)
MLEEYEKRIQFVQDLLNNLLAELKR